MDKSLLSIISFIAEHHVMSLASRDIDEISVCSLFYVYVKDVNSFIVASDDKTTHIQHIKQNQNTAGNIVLETKTVGKIQGVQFKGDFLELKSEELKKLYFKKFPYSKLLNPKLWQIKVTHFKMTDNTLGFGKKIIWNLKDKQ
jgi:uncharacterized protein YhbP (UPF0306 family)